MEQVDRRSYVGNRRNRRAGWLHHERRPRKYNDHHIITNSHTPQHPPQPGSNIEQVARIAVASLGGGIILLLLARGVRGMRDGKRSDMAGDK